MMELMVLTLMGVGMIVQYHAGTFANCRHTGRAEVSPARARALHILFCERAECSSFNGRLTIYSFSHFPSSSGDGIVDSEEECDDGKNGDDSDGCRDNCSVPKCGDFMYVQKLTSLTFCSTSIVQSAHLSTTNIPAPAPASLFCGLPISSRVDTFLGEQCDDGKNGDDTDGCRDDCTKPDCGDGR